MRRTKSYDNKKSRILKRNLSSLIYQVSRRSSQFRSRISYGHLEALHQWKMQNVSLITSNVVVEWFAESRRGIWQLLIGQARTRRKAKASTCVEDLTRFQMKWNLLFLHIHHQQEEDEDCLEMERLRTGFCAKPINTPEFNESMETFSFGGMWNG